ncbi:DUF1330 domain-containing protein [Sedimenticola selenatireducens]|uniref:DUF1330 domain-containing protein n=1 Tax=Sedimenticola selenatireducens TaxID=191960 RepID=UPI003F4ABA7F
MNNAYVIGHISVKNSEMWAEYRDRVPATLEPWGAELLLRGKLVAVLGGAHVHTDTVVIRFPSLDAVNGWHASAAYQALIPLRQMAADVDLLTFEE